MVKHSASREEVLGIGSWILCLQALERSGFIEWVFDGQTPDV